MNFHEKWDTSCPDWEERIADGRSLIPDLPLFDAPAEKALRIFKKLRVPDLEGTPTYGEVCRQWVFDLVRVIFGSYDPETKKRYIREFFLLVPKKNGKSAIAAGIIVTAAIMNARPEAELLLVAPTKLVADIAYKQAAGIIRNDPELSKLFKEQSHKRQITHQRTHAVILIKAADTDVVTGGKATFTLIDETHVFAKKPKAADVFVELRGALASRPEGFLMQITTQSKQAPAGVFKKELQIARDVRDGKLDQPLLPILYELPDALREEWKDPKTWGMVNPNLSASVDANFLSDELAKAERNGIVELALFASQHFNVEVGVGLRSDGWAGAEYWEKAEDGSLTFESIIARSDIVLVGVDGGGLDDIFGLSLLGRDAATRDWLSWAKGWCHEGVLYRRKSIAAHLRDFEADGDLIIVDDNLRDCVEIVGLIERVHSSGKLAGLAVDTEGPYGELMDMVAPLGITDDSGLLIGVPQGIRLMNAIKASERKLANGTFRHAPSKMMDWCVGNLKIEATATAIRATKQNAGDAKIDPIMALFDAAYVMQTNPQSGASVYETKKLMVF